MNSANYLLNVAIRLELPSHREVELVIQLVDYPASGKYECWYYFVNHKQRLLFWVDEYDLRNIFANVRDVSARSHMSRYE